MYPLINIMFLGNDNVGKSCIINRLINNTFLENFENIVGVNFFSYNLQIDEQSIPLQLWEMSGNKKFDKQLHIFSRTMKGFIICFDITDKNSFQEVIEWKKQIENISNESNRPIILVGNKCDQIEQRVITPEEAQTFANQNAMQYYEISAKKDIKIKEMIQEITRLILNTLPRIDIIEEPNKIKLEKLEATSNNILFHPAKKNEHAVIIEENNIFYKLFQYFFHHHLCQGPRGDQLEEFGNLYNKLLIILSIKPSSAEFKEKSISTQFKEDKSLWVVGEKNRKQEHKYIQLIYELLEMKDEDIKAQLAAFIIWKNAMEKKLENKEVFLLDAKRIKNILEALEKPQEVKKTVINKLGI